MAGRDGKAGKRPIEMTRTSVSRLERAELTVADEPIDPVLVALVDSFDESAGLFDATGRFLTGNDRFLALLADAGVAVQAAAPLSRMLSDLKVAGRLADDGDSALQWADAENIAEAEELPACGLRDPAGEPQYLTTQRLATGQILVRVKPYAGPQAEQTSLVSTARMYRDIYENAPIGIYRSSLEGRLLAANPALVRMNGYDSEAELLVGVNDLGREWYVEADRRATFADILERDGFVRNFESEIFRHRTGERIWISEDARLIRDAQGRPVCYEGSVREITAQKRAEDMLRNSEARFRQAFEQGPLGMCITDSNGVFQQVNQAYCDFFGFAPEDLLGNSVLKVMHPEMAPQVHDALHRVITLGKPDGPHQRRYRHKEGHDIWCRVALSPLELPGGRGRHVMAQVQDVTGMAQAEQARQSSERRFQDLVEGSIQGVFIHRNWQLLFVNEALAQMLGYDDAADLLTLSNSDLLFREEDRPRIHDYADARSRGEAAPTRYEVLCQRKDGSPLWTELLVTLVEWGGEKAIQATVIDIQERKQAEFDLRAAKEIAERASRSKSEFLANMSHELRTPLNAILGFSEVITDQLFGGIGNERYLDYARDINDSGKHLLQVINDILDLSRIEAGKLELDLALVRLTESLDSCHRLLRERARDASVDLACEVPDDLPSISADPVKLKQILLNLLTNAIKFTPEGGHVSVDAGMLESGELRIVVRDTGIGMKPDDIRTALAPFGQVESVLARRHHGTGLGLPLVQSLVSLHGGRVSLQSELGKGTEVTVLWPSHLVSAIENPG